MRRFIFTTVLFVLLSQPQMVVAGDDDDCEPEGAFLSLARMLQETDFGHPGLAVAAAPHGGRCLDAGHGVWFSLVGNGEPPLSVYLSTDDTEACPLTTQSFCVTFSPEWQQSPDPLLPQLRSNILNFLAAKDHGEYASVPESCSWVYLSLPEAHRGSLASQRLDLHAHWWAFSLWLIVYLLTALLVYLFRKGPALRPDSSLVRWTLLAGFAGFLMLMAATSWDSIAFSGLWLLLWLLSYAVLRRVARRKAWAIPFFLLFIFAIYLRIRAPHLPANWYVALQTPDSLDVAAVVGSGGFSGIFRFLGVLLPVSSTWVYAWNTLASAITVVFFTWAAFRAVLPDGTRRWPAWAPAVFGVLLSINPILVRIGASDATQVTAVFALSLGAVCYVEASRGSGVIWWFGALLAGALVGWTRFEYAPAPLIWPMLFGVGDRELRHRLAWGPGVVLLAGCAAGASLVLRDVHTEISPFSSMQWTWQHITSWIRVISAQFLREHNLNQAVYWFFVPFALWSLLSLRWQRLGLVVAFYVLVAPRIVSSFHEPEIAWNLIVARYDLAILVVMLLWTAGGVHGTWRGIHWLLQRLSRLRQLDPRVFAASTVLTGVIAFALFSNGLPRNDISNDRFPFQEEYLFLREQLDAGDVNRVHAIWQQGDRHEDHDFDTGLAMPHPLLVMDYPEVQWTVANELRPDRVSEPSYIFPGANAQLDSVAAQTMGYPAIADSASSLKKLQRDAVRHETVLVERRIRHPDVLRFPLTDDTLVLTWWYHLPSSFSGGN